MTVPGERQWTKKLICANWPAVKKQQSWKH